MHIYSIYNVYIFIKIVFGEYILFIYIIFIVFIYYICMLEHRVYSIKYFPNTKPWYKHSLGVGKDETPSDAPFC